MRKIFDTKKVDVFKGTAKNTSEKNNSKNNYLRDFLHFVYNLFYIFKNKKFYLSFIPDFFLVFFFMFLGYLLNAFSYKYSSNFILLFLITLLVFIALWILYAISRYYFYIIISQKEKFYDILFKHLISFLLIITLNFIFIATLYIIMKNLLFVEYVETFKQNLIGFFYLITYLSILFYHKSRMEFNSLNLFFYVFKSYSQMFKIKNYIFLIYDFFILFIFYIFFNIISFGFQITLKYYSNISVLNMWFENFTNIYMIFIFIVLLTVNKLIVYKVDFNKI